MGRERPRTGPGRTPRQQTPPRNRAGGTKENECSTRKTVSIEWGGKTLTLETGQIARQADGAVLATYGETVVLCAVTAARSVKEGQDFFPLTVHYQEKFSAAGRIPGGFFKREGRATEKETLTSRLIDRPVRPLFPEGFYNEINVIAQVLSYGWRNRARYRSDDRRVGGAHPQRPAVHGSDRRRARRFQGMASTSSIPASTASSRKAGSIWSSAGTQDAVMMVESEAKETDRGRDARRRHVRA